MFFGLAIESSDDFEGARKDYDTVLSKLEGDGYSVELEERGIADWERMEEAREDTERFQKLGLGFGIATAALAVTTIVLFTVGGSGESTGNAVSAAPGGLAVSF